MKKNLTKLFFAIMFVATTSLCAQAPNAFNYQAVLRNANGDLITGQLVEMRFSIRNGAATASILYSETQTVTPNEFGLVDHAIGTGTAVNGTFSNVNWATGVKFLQVEMNTGGGFVDLGAEKLNSVPFALYSNNPGTPGPAGPVGATGPQGPAGNANISGITNRLIKFTGANTGGNSQIFDNGTNVGIGTTNPNAPLHVVAADDALTLSVSSSSDSATPFYVQTGAGDAFIIRANGRTGLGTINPIQRLDVNGRMNINNGVIQRGGAPITATNDMGLYSRVAGNFLRLVTNAGDMEFHTVEGANGTGALPRLRIEHNGNSPYYWRIREFNGECGLHSNLDNYGYIGRPDERIFRIYANTYYGTNSSIQAISDRSLKTNVSNLSQGLTALMQLRPVAYDFIPEKLYPLEDSRKKLDDKDIYNQMGFIAQELEGIFPGLIRDMVKDDGTILKTVGYSGLIPVLVKGMQEQQEQIETLKREIEAIKNK